MVTRTFLSKCTTIFNGSNDNFGFNPIGMLNYGHLVSRALIYFNIDNIKSARDGGFTKEGTRHILNLTNCGSIDQKTFDEMVVSSDNKGIKERASSFEIVVFKIPELWDAGRGFDNSTDFWLLGKNSSSQHGATWYHAYDGKVWGTEIDKNGDIVPVEGCINLEEEYKKYENKENSLILTTLRFDTGNENFKIDITDFINDLLDEKCENFGIGLAFAPYLEALVPKYTQYVGFFTNHTNTFFQPYIESRCSNAIVDNRYSFHLNKNNKLYFYAILDGVYTDLDTLPICTIDCKNSPVSRVKTGVYCAEATLPSTAKANAMYYDTWSNLIYKGEDLGEVELEFVALPKENYFKLGERVTDKISCEPSLSGINDNEKIYQGDERTIDVKFRIAYSSDYELINDCQYRIYVKDGKREVDVIDWDNIDVEGMCNLFKIKTGELLPAQYHIDIKAKIGNDTRIFKDKLQFTVVDNVTEMKK